VWEWSGGELRLGEERRDELLRAAWRWRDWLDESWRVRGRELLRLLFNYDESHHLDDLESKIGGKTLIGDDDDIDTRGDDD
jgi:hypothetical protein